MRVGERENALRCVNAAILLLLPSICGEGIGRSAGGLQDGKYARPSRPALHHRAGGLPAVASGAYEIEHAADSLRPWPSLINRHSAKKPRKARNNLDAAPSVPMMFRVDPSGECGRRGDRRDRTQLLRRGSGPGRGFVRAARAERNRREGQDRSVRRSSHSRNLYFIG